MKDPKRFHLSGLTGILRAVVQTIRTIDNAIRSWNAAESI